MFSNSKQAIIKPSEKTVVTYVSIVNKLFHPKSITQPTKSMLETCHNGTLEYLIKTITEEDELEEEEKM